MQTNKIEILKLYFFVIILIMVELTIISLSKFYIDIIGVFLLVLVINKIYLFRHLVLISLIADFIGQWYLGTHLLTIILISFISDRYYSYYKILNSIQKIIYNFIFVFLQLIIIFIISIVTKAHPIYLFTFGIELLLLPIIFILTQKILNNKKPVDIFY